MTLSPQRLEKAAEALRKELQMLFARSFANLEDASVNSYHMEYADACLTALADAGMVVLPEMPTQEMYAAWMCDHKNWLGRYTAMIKAHALSAELTERDAG